ncbi:MAG: hypothetical protein LBJ11_07290 [Oscillospiraceae bacterium]|nr:hypothetical protein [Oscillospiraceae bacterium]
MKTLLIYHSTSRRVIDLCEGAACGDVDVLALAPRYRRGALWNAVVGALRALAGKGNRIEPLEVDLSQYDAIVLATSLRFCAPSAECNEFLYRYNLAGREVTSLVFSRVRLFGRSMELMRKRIRLAGGVCRGIVCLSESTMPKAESTNVLALAKLRTYAR